MNGARRRSTSDRYPPATVARFHPHDLRAPTRAGTSDTLDRCTRAIYPSKHHFAVEPRTTEARKSGVAPGKGGSSGSHSPMAAATTSA